MLVQVSNNGRKWAVCTTSDPHLRHATRKELKAAESWYYGAVHEGRIKSERALGLKLDDRGCVEPQIVIPYRPKCAHRGWGRGKNKKRLLATCPQGCSQDLFNWETVKADREYFRDVKNATRSDHVEHDMSVEREFEMARWRSLVVKAQIEAARVLWWDYPRDSRKNEWIGAKLYCLRHFSRALEVVIEYHSEDNLLTTLKDIARDEKGAYLPTSM
jgi:hypothetical protein